MASFQLRRLSVPRCGSGAQYSIVSLDKDVLKFGRNPDQVDIVLNSEFYNNMISRDHAEIRRQRSPDGGVHFVLYDRSLNGTYVNSYRVGQPVQLRHGDIINFGHINGAAINPGDHAPQPDAEFSFQFEKCSTPSQSSAPVSAASQLQSASAAHSLQTAYQQGSGSSPAQLAPYFAGGSNHALISQINLAAAAYGSHPGYLGAGLGGIHPLFQSSSSVQSAQSGSSAQSQSLRDTSNIAAAVGADPWLYGNQSAAAVQRLQGATGNMAAAGGLRYPHHQQQLEMLNSNSGGASAFRNAFPTSVAFPGSGLLSASGLQQQQMGMYLQQQQQQQGQQQERSRQTSQQTAGATTARSRQPQSTAAAISNPLFAAAAAQQQLLQQQAGFQMGGLVPQAMQQTLSSQQYATTMNRMAQQVAGAQASQSHAASAATFQLQQQPSSAASQKQVTPQVQQQQQRVTEENVPRPSNSSISSITPNTSSVIASTTIQSSLSSSSPASSVQQQQPYHQVESGLQKYQLAQQQQQQSPLQNSFPASQHRASSGADCKPLPVSIDISDDPVQAVVSSLKSPVPQLLSPKQSVPEARAVVVAAVSVASTSSSSTTNTSTTDTVCHVPLKMECDSSVPSPPDRKETTEAENEDSQAINKELASLASKCRYSESPDADDMFNIAHNDSDKEEPRKLSSSNEIHHSSTKAFVLDLAARSEKDPSSCSENEHRESLRSPNSVSRKRKSNEVARLLDDITRSSFVYSIRKKSGELTPSSDDENTESADSDSDNRQPTKRLKLQNNGKKTEKPSSLSSPKRGRSSVIGAKSPVRKSHPRKNSASSEDSETESSDNENSDSGRDIRGVNARQKSKLAAQSKTNNNKSSAQAKRLPPGKAPAVSLEAEAATTGGRSSKSRKSTTVVSTPRSGNQGRNNNKSLASESGGGRQRGLPPSSAPSATTKKGGKTTAKKRKAAAKSSSDPSSSEEEEESASENDDQWDMPLSSCATKTPTSTSRRAAQRTSRKTQASMARIPSKAVASTKRTPATQTPRESRGRAKNLTSTKLNLSDETLTAMLNLSVPLPDTLHNPNEACAAKVKCKKPDEENVDWIQCDDCDDWYHANCIDCNFQTLKDEDAPFHCGCA